MPSWIQTFRDQPFIAGKISFVFYAVVILLGGLTGILGILAPLPAGDCMTDVFAPLIQGHEETLEQGGGNDTDMLFQQQRVDQLVWVRALGRMLGLFTMLFIIAVALLGHSTRSCLLLFCAPTLNFFHFDVWIRTELKITAGGGSQAALDCVQNYTWQIVMFWVLTGVAFLGAWIQDYQQSMTLLTGGNGRGAGSRSGAASESTPLTSAIPH